MFFIYIYQRWLYPVDHTRAVLGMELDETERPQDQSQPSLKDNEQAEVLSSTEESDQDEDSDPSEESVD